MCCRDPKFDSPATRDDWVRIDDETLADVALAHHTVPDYDAGWDCRTLVVDGVTYYAPGRAA